MFPSTTTAHVTTLFTGATVGESGIYEWVQKHNSVGEMVYPLRYEYLDSHQKLETDVRPGLFFPSTRLNFELRDSDVHPYCYMPGAIRGPSNRYFAARSTKRNFSMNDEVEADLMEGLARNERSFHIVYLPDIDRVGHKKGPSSEEYQEEARNVLARVTEMIERVKTQHPEAVVLVTSDHGHIDVNPVGDGVVMLNEEFPELERSFELSTSGQLLLPAGSMRDSFLHIRETELDRVYDLLRRNLEDRVAVYKTSELIERGVFGAVTDNLERNIGNITLLPLEEGCIHWQGHLDNQLDYRGDHGGMSREEMEIPFLCIA
jgi:predicted AlkP superfamily pyrophosphatase or phosphodiesterase